MTRGWWIGLGFLGLLAIIAAGVIPRLQRRAALSTETRALVSDIPRVDTAIVHTSQSGSVLTLPGSMQAVQEAPIYARTNGYLRRRLVDIGDRVQAGALLAVIESPEVDQELAQARANVSHASAAVKQAEASLARGKSQLQLAQVTVERWKQLAKEGVVSRQEGDEKQSAFEAAVSQVDADSASVNASESDVEALRANVRRLEEMQGFEKVTAPFDGVITARNFDAGALITSGSTAGTREIFRLASNGQLRVFVDVPQTHAASIHTGMPAIVQVSELSHKQFPGSVARTADALNPTSRTLLAEVHISNESNELRPGMFASVKFAIGKGTGPVIAPSSAVQFGTTGPHVSLVLEAKIHIVPVTIGRDLGATLEITNGLADGERVVLNPADELKEGVTVSLH